LSNDLPLRWSGAIGRKWCQCAVSGNSPCHLRGQRR